MQIIIVSHKFSSRARKYINMFYFKPPKINLNIISKTIVLGIYCYILIELIYCIFIENIIVSYLNVYTTIEKDFRLTLELCKSVLKTLEASTINGNC